MEEKGKTRRAHCLVLPYPSQGHVNPMLQFCKLLEHQGVRITLVTTRSYYNNLQKMPPSIALETISDGFDKGGVSEARGFTLYFKRFLEVGPETFAQLLEKLGGSEDDHVDCVVYDSSLPWALDVAKRFGVVGAAYFTQNMTVSNIYYHVHLGKLQVPLTDHEISLPAMPKLQHKDMPSFFFTYEQNQFMFDLVLNQFSNIDKADWIMCNIFYELEKEIVDWIKKIWPKFRTIGPNIPSFFLDKSDEDDQEYQITQFKSEDCMEWLDNKPKGSVVYVSFGSMFNLSEEQLQELASCLKECSSYNFLWVVKASEEIRLPKDFERKTEKVLVVTWCSQLKVLAHEAIGCFVTHSGWNSTLETLCLGVPTITIPYYSDQFTNAKLMTDVWKIGIRVPIDKNKIVRRQTLTDCIKEIMESEKGKEMKSNATQWKTLAAKATAEGGSSHENILEFVSSLLHS
ncbi:unnamed protein product [Sphenostylis stenocarpa]|uniref:Glycosyltransferase n=1 Tax=Sphenostylis stenocarpa TaxID=92480 RepID=A0AA86SAY1_9FABA|nr:unnamed protein product [Sphenostylis stenocarpa]